ncbi:MAG: hypothetical protein LBD51_08200 [Bifidobacteriaceae bacterium]|jgi:hypothetical protein|nr:hypothetical protein [Bifidobacteriaceae bacterium]
MSNPPLRPARPGRVAALACLALSLGLALPAADAADAATDPPACPAAPAAGEDASAIEWSAAPADEAGPDGRVSLRHTLEPGGAASDAIAVTNLGAATATYQVSTGPGAVGQDGLFDIVAPGQAGAGDWIEIGGLQDGAVTLASCETRVLPVGIAVPAAATPGDHPVGIAVGVSLGSEVALTHRIGIRVHLRVAGEIAPALKVTVVDRSFTASPWPFAPGRLEVAYEIENTGNVRLGAKVAIAAAGPFGLAGREMAGEAIRELLPGEKVQGSAGAALPALLRLDGAVEVTPVKVGEDETTAPAPLSRSFAAAAVSWPTLAALAALLAGLVCLLARRHRARTKAKAKGAA